MKAPQANRVLIVVTMFIAAVVYASYCTTSCALEGWPEATHRSGSHDSSPHHSRDSHDDGPGDPSCAAADHFGAYIATAPGMAQLDFINVGRVNVTGTPRLETSSSIMSSFWLSGLVPPPKLKTSVYDQVSVLRI